MTHKIRMTRRAMLVGTAATAVIGRPAIAQKQTLTVSTWGGVTQDGIKAYVAPEFEKRTGATLAFDIGGQGARYNKLLAQRNNPPADVFFSTDEALIAGRRAGILTSANRKNLPNLADIHDCGRSLNPAIDRGQIEGGFVQGMGWLTAEELWWDDAGRLRTHAPSTYKIPGSRDVPADFRIHMLTDAPNREPTIFRSKAVGEPPLMLAISVWLALRDAVASVAEHRLVVSLDAPATPERVLAAVDDIRARFAQLTAAPRALNPAQ